MASSGGNANGNALTGDGLFIGVDLDLVRNAGVRMTDVTDGLSNTVAFSETTLGAGGPRPTNSTDNTRFYKQVTSLTQANCDASTTLVTDRGALWADGAYNSTLFNTVRPPNSPLMDCVQHSNPAWKSARSRHEQGVNVLLGDGGVRFMRDSIQPQTWTAMGTRNGGEVVSVE
jgi:hypothetical protein